MWIITNGNLHVVYKENDCYLCSLPNSECKNGNTLYCVESLRPQESAEGQQCEAVCDLIAGGASEAIKCQLKTKFVDAGKVSRCAL